MCRHSERRGWTRCDRCRVISIDLARASGTVAVGLWRCGRSRKHAGKLDPFANSPLDPHGRRVGSVAVHKRRMVFAASTVLPVPTFRCRVRDECVEYRRGSSPTALLSLTPGSCLTHCSASFAWSEMTLERVRTTYRWSRPSACPSPSRRPLVYRSRDVVDLLTSSEAIRRAAPQLRV